MKNRKTIFKAFALVACLLCALSGQARELAYAIYTSEDSTLTFYYDSNEYGHTTYPCYMNYDESEPDWHLYGYHNNIVRVVFDPSFANARPTTTSKWFWDMRKLRTIEGMEYLNTSNVTTMLSMFYNCQSLESVDLSHFNTSRVKNMAVMFS